MDFFFEKLFVSFFDSASYSFYGVRNVFVLRFYDDSMLPLAFSCFSSSLSLLVSFFFGGGGILGGGGSLSTLHLCLFFLRILISVNVYVHVHVYAPRLFFSRVIFILNVCAGFPLILQKKKRNKNTFLESAVRTFFPFICLLHLI